MTSPQQQPSRQPGDGIPPPLNAAAEHATTLASGVTLTRSAELVTIAWVGEGEHAPSIKIQFDATRPNPKLENILTRNWDGFDSQKPLVHPIFQTLLQSSSAKAIHLEHVDLAKLSSGDPIKLHASEIDLVRCTCDGRELEIVADSYNLNGSKFSKGLLQIHADNGKAMETTMAADLRLIGNLGFLEIGQTSELRCDATGADLSRAVSRFESVRGVSAEAKIRMFREKNAGLIFRLNNASSFLRSTAEEIALNEYEQIAKAQFGSTVLPTIPPRIKLVEQSGSGTPNVEVETARQAAVNPIAALHADQIARVPAFSSAKIDATTPVVYPRPPRMAPPVKSHTGRNLVLVGLGAAVLLGAAAWWLRSRDEHESLASKQTDSKVVDLQRKASGPSAETNEKIKELERKVEAPVSKVEDKPAESSPAPVTAMPKTELVGPQLPAADAQKVSSMPAPSFTSDELRQKADAGLSSLNGPESVGGVWTLNQADVTAFTTAELRYAARNFNGKEELRFAAATAATTDDVSLYVSTDLSNATFGASTEAPTVTQSGPTMASSEDVSQFAPKSVQDAASSTTP